MLLSLSLQRVGCRSLRDPLLGHRSLEQLADTRTLLPQGRYILRHPWWEEGRACEAARACRRELPKRFEQQAQTLASLTGWDINKIRGRMNLKASGPPDEDEPWWKAIWKD